MRDSKLLECYKKDNGEFLWSVKVPTKVENLFQIDSDRIFIGDYNPNFTVLFLLYFTNTDKYYSVSLF